MSELTKRGLSGVAMIALALAALWLGGIWFTLLLVLVASLMLNEWRALAHKLGWGLPGLAIGIVYVSLPCVALILMRQASFGLAIWTLAVVWATDISAYVAGRLVGGPKIAPAISPSKTWAGLVGGMVGAGVVGWLLARNFDLTALLYGLGAAFAVVAQAGDFFESWMKRRAGVKDSGSLIPGHGGALDRLDGLVPVATAMGLLFVTGALAI